MKHQRDETINWNEISIEEILQRAITDEEESRDYYKHAADSTGDMHTRRLLLAFQRRAKGTQVNCATS